MSGLEKEGEKNQPDLQQIEEAARETAFEMERQQKAVAQKAKEAKEMKAVGELLKCVAYGEQDQAEGMLKEDKSLVLKKGRVTDLSKREFKEITGFQYALWALDWHMWKMLLKYMDKEAAAIQFAELEEKGTAHGKHFSLAPLLEVLNTYVKNHDGWHSRQSAWGKMGSYWSREVGGAQRLLPVHVVNEYCHPTRSFVPCPGFIEEELVRSMKLSGELGNWFTAVYDGGKLGEKFGVVRYKSAAAADSVIGQQFFSGLFGSYVKRDAEAIQSLWTVRQLQLEALKAELVYFVSVNRHLPPALTEIILSYLSEEGTAVSVPRM